MNYDQYPTSVEQYAKRVFGDPKHAWQTNKKQSTKTKQNKIKKQTEEKKYNKMKKKMKKKDKKKEEKNRYSIFQKLSRGVVS